MRHCIDKILAIVAGGSDDRRAVFQLGYNLGRLSELSGLGREPFWDRWKGPVERWDLDEMGRLAQELHAWADTAQPYDHDRPEGPEMSRGS